MADARAAFRVTIEIMASNDWSASFEDRARYRRVVGVVARDAAIAMDLAVQKALAAEKERADTHAADIARGWEAMTHERRAELATAGTQPSAVPEFAGTVRVVAVELLGDIHIVDG